MKTQTTTQTIEAPAQTTGEHPLDLSL